jgi:hypothetical protein
MSPKDLLPWINPKTSPKYSPNLYAWIIKQWGGLDANLVVTRADDWGGRWIGHLDEDGWLFCSSLMGVLGHGAKEETCAIQNTTRVDIAFFERYIQDGRCAIDPNHRMEFIGSQTRWLVVPASGAKPERRECLWCGHHVQVKLDWTETVHKSEWVPA